MLDNIVVLSGRNAEDALKEAVSYFPSRDVGGEDPWEGFVNLPEARYEFGAASLSDTIYLMGEHDNHRENNNGLAMLDNNWVSLLLEQNISIHCTDIVSHGSQMIMFVTSSNIEDIKPYAYQVFFTAFISPLCHKKGSSLFNDYHIK